MIDVATDAGVNQVNGISYSYSDSVTAYDQAVEAALDRAVEKAQKIADKEGKTLAWIKTIQEDGTSYEYILAHADLGQYDDANQLSAHLNDYVTDHGGQCTVTAQEGLKLTD